MKCTLEYDTTISIRCTLSNIGMGVMACTSTTEMNQQWEHCTNSNVECGTSSVIAVLGTYCTHTVLAFPLIGLSTMYYERATNYDTNVLANCITITRNNRVPSYTGFISSTFIVPIGRCYGIVTCGDGENDKDLYCICTIHCR